MNDVLALPAAASTLDDAAFCALLEEGARANMALAVRMLRNPEEARETLQDAWFRAWRHRGALRTGEAGHAWVRAIVARECLRKLRWRGWVRIFVEVDPVDPRPTPEALTADAELLRRVRAKVERLSARQRVVWGLRHDEGLSIPEIAAALGLSPETVKTHLSRADEVIRGI